MSANGRTPSDISELQTFMRIFKDIRTSSVIIADSIRTRERTALRATGLLHEPPAGDCSEVDISDPVRCPICMGEYYDPTAVSKICGHGMHADCAKTQLAKNGNHLSLAACPLCRAPFHKDDLIILRGILPSTTNAAAWRTVHLTEPWQEGLSNAQSHSKHPVDGCLDRLLVNIRFLFRAQNDFSRAIGEVLDVYNTITDREAASRQILNRSTEELAERERKVLKAEETLSHRTIAKERLASACADNIREYESSLLRTMDKLVRKQLQLDRTSAAIKSQEEDLHTRMREFDERCKSEKQAIRDMQDKISTDRKILSTRRNALLLLGNHPKQIFQENQSRQDRMQYSDGPVHDEEELDSTSERGSPNHEPHTTRASRLAKRSRN